MKLAIRLLLPTLLLAFLPRTAKSADITGWNKWKDAQTLEKSLMKATKAHKTYFSAFKFYAYLDRGSLKSRMSSDLGFPYMYGVDLYQGSGDYFPAEETAKVRKYTASIVKAAWEKNHAIAQVSWHLHCPYAVYSDFGKKMGCRYRYGEPGYPENHRYVIREILDDVRVDTLGITTMGDWFDRQVREIADIINTDFVDSRGKAIPFVFRLWHEQQHSWAWWNYSGSNPSKGFVTVEDYKAFWRLTVEKFRKYCPKAEILWCYCPDAAFFSTMEGYMESYPGDGYVDVFAYDDYGIVSKKKDPAQTFEKALNHARIVSRAAESHRKPAMIAETNCMNKAYRGEYFDYVQRILLDSEVRIAVFQLWSMSYHKEETKKFIESDNVIFD